MKAQINRVKKTVGKGTVEILLLWGEKSLAKALKLKRDNLWKSNWKETSSHREI